MGDSYFCVSPKNHWLMFFSKEMLKSTVTKIVIMHLFNLSEENFSKKQLL